jgi:hypothetical protein
MVISDVMVVKSIHFFRSSKKHEEYRDEIPLGLILSMSQTAKMKRLGEPVRSGGGNRVIFGAFPAWDKYYFKRFSLHLQYSEVRNKIDLITINSLSLEAEVNRELQ